MPFRRRALATAVVLGAILALPAGASAHALLVSSDPAAGTSVATAPTAITLTFSEAPDLGLSRIRVLDASGTERRVDAPQAVPGEPRALRVGVGPLEQGVYTVAWRTVSTADGHASAGSFAFGVGAGTVVTTAPQQQEGGGTVSGLATAARWLLYLGLAALLGGALVGAVLHPAPPRRLATYAAAGWVAAAVGTAGVLTAQWLDSGADLRAFWLSSLAIPAVARAAAAAASGAAVRLLPWARRPAYLLLAGAAGAAMLVDVLAGHPAAAAQPALAIATQYVHGLTAAAWIGGLAALLVATRGQSTDEKITAVRRYSTVAGALLALVALTGLLRAIDQVGTIGALFTTDFGRVVIVKSAGLLALAGFGALNRFVNVPAIASSFAGLRRVGSAEVLAGVGVLLLSAILVNLPPPLRAGTTPALPPVVAKGSDFGTTLKLRLTVTPGTPGFNSFQVSAIDFDSGAPVPATSMSLRFTPVSQTGVGTSTLDLNGTAEGAFAGDGGNLSIDGIWTVTALVQAPSGAVEVPLVLATRVRPQPVSADPSITPVIYSVALGGGRTVQTYLDPGRAGKNDVHVTFFDASGGELPVQSATMSLAPAEGSGVLADERLLEPGHLVASVDLPSGDVAVDVVGPDPGGGQIHVSVVMKVAP